MRGAIALAATVVCLYGSACAAAAPVDTAILGPGFARNARIDATVQRADAALGRAPHAVAEIHIEGVSAGLTSAPGVAVAKVGADVGPAASRQALADMDVMRDLALAWRLTGKRAYLRQAGRYLDAWASTYRLSFNPIDEGDLDALILAYDLTEADLPRVTRTRVDAFLRQMATGYIQAMETGNVPIKPTLTNNWQSHRIKLATLTAFQIGDDALQARARRLFEKQIGDNLRDDGSTLDFAQRDALHYVTFSLESLLMAALAAKAHGQDWYRIEAAGGRSLARTLGWLARFAEGEAVHIEFAKSMVPYDRQRAASGQATYQDRPWDPRTALLTYMLAGQIDPQFVPLREKLQGSASAEQSIEVEHGSRIDWLMLMDAGSKSSH